MNTRPIFKAHQENIYIDAIRVSPSMLYQDEFSAIFTDHENGFAYEVSHEGAELQTVAVFEQNAYGAYSDRRLVNGLEAVAIVRELLYEASCYCESNLGDYDFGDADGIGKERVIGLLLSYF